MLGGSLNLTCVAVGSPMPFVKWRRLDEDLTPENEITVGKSVLYLNDIRSSNNYTCVASSSLGVIEAHTVVKVQCKSGHFLNIMGKVINLHFFHSSALPIAPTELKITEVTATTVRLEWSYK
jgi:receptor-type tyrosine-protein phosphatase F